MEKEGVRLWEDDDEKWVTEDRGGVDGSGGIVNLDREGESAEDARAPQTRNKQHRVAVPQHKHKTAHTHTHIHQRSISDSTQTSKHQLFQLCGVCSFSLLPLHLIHTHTHHCSILSLAFTLRHSSIHPQVHRADTIWAMLYKVWSLEGQKIVV